MQNLLMIPMHWRKNIESVHLMLKSHKTIPKSAFKPLKDFL